MKKNDLILIAGTALFSFLFYQQGAGLNVFLFALLMPVLLAIYKPESLSNRLWMLGAFLTILTGFSVFVNSTFLSLLAFYTAISYLAGVTVSRNASPLTAMGYATISYASSVGFMIADALDRKKAAEVRDRKKINWGAVITMGIFILVVVALFFFLYQTANPLFKEITKFINLDFISFEWVMFTFMGFLLVYGFFYTRFIRSWDTHEKASLFNINSEHIMSKANRFLWFSMDEQLERKAGVVLFILLNLMILVINVLDISFLWSGIKLPDGFTFAGYLHQGIYTLIFSCVLAILLILLIFRGRMNFMENNKTLKVMAYMWIFQNIIIAVSSAMRNTLYISSYALTYKRITIFVLLILLITGLISTLYKIRKQKNIYYLFRLNSFAFLLVFVAVSLFNWDGIITRYNLKNSEFPDINYLTGLNESGLHHLLYYAETNPEGETITGTFKSRSFYTPESYYWQRPYLNDIIYGKTYRLLERTRDTGWKSYNLSDALAVKRIKKLYETGELRQFVVSNEGGFDIGLLTEFTGLQSLTIRESLIPENNRLSALAPFSKLKELRLISTGLSSVDDLPRFEHLSSLNLSNNQIRNLDHLRHYNGLQELDISGNPVENIDFLEYLPDITSLDISGTSVTDLSVLEKLPKLSKLTLSSLQNASFETLPVCPNLVEIDVSHNTGLSTFRSIANVISGASSLEKVQMTNINLGSLAYISDTVMLISKKQDPGLPTFRKDVLEHIIHLNVSSNNLTNLNGIGTFSNLEVIDLQHNNISDISHIRNCRKVKNLNLSGNPVQSIKGIGKLNSVRFLHFSNFLFTDVSALQSLEQLEALTLSNGTFSNEQLIEMKNLRYLDLSNSSFTSLDFVAHLPKLEFLNLSGYYGSDFEHLLNCPSLKVLVLPRIPMKLKRQLEQEIPQIRIIRDWEFADQQFYLSKYGM